ncbi:MAG TPA: alpha/beta hydrolase-fold protein [Mucilaginibacter sp.]|nr:alpha/beta hydrolase-fold protein [Mucilaginibacter sp.]
MEFAALLLLLGGMAAVAAFIIKYNGIVWGQPGVIYSGILGEARRIRIFLPAGYNKAALNKQQYPVIYLFDGDALSAEVIKGLTHLRQQNPDAHCPEMIVVAVSNTDRASDFTPTISSIGPEGDELDMLKNSGGSENFIGFIEKELIPYIESIYPTSPYKTLMGYSLGGLTVINILITRTKMFDAYAAIDPSMWWDNRIVLNDAAAKFEGGNFTGTSLFLGVANTMPIGMDITQAKGDTTGSTNHIRSLLKLIDILGSNPGNGLRWQHKYYPDKDHDSVVPPGIYDALHFLFYSQAINARGSSNLVKNQ